MPCFEAHHETTPKHLVLCHGARFDVTLNGYLPKKPEFCSECGNFKGNGKVCRIGYVANSTAKVCSQAIELTAPRSF